MFSKCMAPLFGAILLVGLGAKSLNAEPPYGDTVYAEPGILVASDPSRLLSFDYEGLESFVEWDHRVEAEVRADFHVYNAYYRGGHSVQFLVNAEYDSERQARSAGRVYAYVLGQIPQILRVGVRRLVVHETGGNWSASPRHMTIHDGFVEQETADGALEESMIHEGVHTSLDYRYENSSDWIAAQQADAEFISDYARENSSSEDFSESWTLYYAYVMHPDRLTRQMRTTIMDVMPARMAYFAKLFPKGKLGT